MRQPVNVHPEFMLSPSVLALDESERAKPPLDWVCSDPDAYGCFRFDPTTVWVNQRTMFPSQTLNDVEYRLHLYQQGSEPMLEVWTENSRTYGHWVAWFKPVRGTSKKLKRLNTYDPSKMGDRRTPIPPSLREVVGDVRQIEDWDVVRSRAAETNRSRRDLAGISQGFGRDESSLLDSYPLPLPPPLPQPPPPPSRAGAREADGGGGGGSSPGDDRKSDAPGASKSQGGSQSHDPGEGPGPKPGGGGIPHQARREPGSGGDQHSTPGVETGSPRRKGTIGNHREHEPSEEDPVEDLAAALRGAWVEATGAECEFTAADFGPAVRLVDEGKAPADVVEAWGWFIRTGPDRKPRHTFAAATPRNFARFGWQAWVASRVRGADRKPPARAASSCGVCRGRGRFFVLTHSGAETAHACRCPAGTGSTHPPAPDNVWAAAEARGGEVLMEAWIEQRDAGTA